MLTRDRNSATSASVGQQPRDRIIVPTSLEQQRIGFRRKINSIAIKLLSNYHTNYAMDYELV